MPLPAVLVAAAVLLAPLATQATFVPHIVTSSQKLSDTAGDLSDPNNPGTNPGSYLANGDTFGVSVAPLGDLDGDGVTDIAVGASGDDDGGSANGALHLLLLKADGTVKGRTKLSTGSPAANGLLSLSGSNFGVTVAPLGDLDGAGPSDFALAVGAFEDPGGGTRRGALFIVFMDQSPLEILSVQKITHGSGSLVLDDDDFFGSGLAVVGDLDSDGIPELAVGAAGDGDGGSLAGAVYILFLDSAGTLTGLQKLATPTGAGAQWGASLAPLGAFDPNDVVPDLAVAAYVDNVSATNDGSLWLVNLNASGTQKGTATEISAATDTRLARYLDADDRFGLSLAVLPDLDGDGTVELLAAASKDDDGDEDAGAAYVLYLEPDGSVGEIDKLSQGWNCLGDILGAGDRAGIGIASLGDLSGDGTHELALGALFADDGGTNRGAIHILSLEQPAQTASHQLVCASLELELFADFPSPLTTTVRQGVSPINAVVGPAGAVSVPGVILGPAPPVSIGGYYPFTFGGLSNLDLAPSPLPTQFVPEVNCGGLSWPDPYGPNPPIVEIGGGFGGNGGFIGRLEFTPSMRPYVPGGYAFSACQIAYPLSYKGNVQVAGLPWTTGTAKVNFRGPPWTGSPTATTTRRGFDLRTASSAGHMSVVTPVAIQWEIGSGFGGPDIPSFARLNLTFVPEPAPLLGLAAGAVFLAVAVRRGLRR